MKKNLFVAFILFVSMCFVYMVHLEFISSQKDFLIKSYIANILIAIISIILLEVVEYIQHYGLKRDIIDNKLEKYNQSHSWNSRHSIADWSTFNLGLHSEHHSIANKEYPLLSHDEKPKEMPANYPTMILMALIPPIWFMVMDKKLNLRN